MKLTKLTTICKVAHAHPRLLAVLWVGGEDTTVALIDLYELLYEGLHGSWRRCSGVLNDANTPALDRTILVVHGELATTAED